MERKRIFDHLTDETEISFFSRIAWQMVRSPQWRSIPEYVPPLPVSGEIEGGN